MLFTPALAKSAVMYQGEKWTSLHLSTKSFRTSVLYDNQQKFNIEAVNDYSADSIRDSNRILPIRFEPKFSIRRPVSIVCSSKSEAEVTSNMRLRSTYCTIKADNMKHRPVSLQQQGYSLYTALKYSCLLSTMTVSCHPLALCCCA